MGGFCRMKLRVCGMNLGNFTGSTWAVLWDEAGWILWDEAKVLWDKSGKNYRRNG